MTGYLPGYDPAHVVHDDGVAAAPSLLHRSKHPVMGGLAPSSMPVRSLIGSGLTGTHYLYYMDSSGFLNRVDWPPTIVGGTTTWNNHLRGTARLHGLVANPFLSTMTDIQAETVLGGADNGAAIWVGGDGEQEYWAMLVDATDLTTVLKGPMTPTQIGQLVHRALTGGDTYAYWTMMATDYRSRAVLGFAFTDTNIPRPPGTCIYFSSENSAHKLVSSLDGYDTVVYSAVIEDSRWDDPDPDTCPIPRSQQTQEYNWPRMGGAFTTNDNHKLFVWIIPRVNIDIPEADTHTDEANYGGQPVYYEIHARLDSATVHTTTVIARSPGQVDFALYEAGFEDGAVGYDPATNLLHCWLQMNVPSVDTPPGTFAPFDGDPGQIFHATFARSGTVFTLATDWVAQPISQISALSPDGRCAIGNIGGRDSQSRTIYHTTNAGASWIIENAQPPNSDVNWGVERFEFAPNAALLPALMEGPDRVGVLINWEHDDDWLSHAADDVVTDMVSGKIVHVAADPRIEVDTWILTLKDPTGIYVPARVESPRYPNVRLNREARWNVERNGIKVCLFHGKIKEYAPVLPHKTDVDRVQKCVIRVESPLRELADAKVTLVTPPAAGVLVAAGGGGVIAQLLALVSDIIPTECLALEVTDVSIVDGFLTTGMSLQSALEQCAIISDSVYYIQPHYRDVPSPKFFFVWKPRTTTHSTVDHTWVETANTVSFLTPRFTADDI